MSCRTNLIIFPTPDAQGGEVGVTITSCLLLTGMVQFGVRQSAEAENLMTSVERVMEYGEIKSEPELTRPGSPESFQDGIVKFQNVSMRLKTFIMWLVSSF